MRKLNFGDTLIASHIILDHGYFDYLTNNLNLSLFQINLPKSLSHVLHPGVILNYDKLVTLLARISYSMNQRQLGLANTSQTGLEPALFSKVLYGDISNISSSNFSSLPHLFSNFSSEIINVQKKSPKIAIFAIFSLLKKRH